MRGLRSVKAGARFLVQALLNASRLGLLLGVSIDAVGGTLVGLGLGSVASFGTGVVALRTTAGAGWEVGTLFMPRSTPNADHTPTRTLDGVAWEEAGAGEAAGSAIGLADVATLDT